MLGSRVLHIPVVLFVSIGTVSAAYAQSPFTFSGQVGPAFAGGGLSGLQESGWSGGVKARHDLASRFAVGIGLAAYIFVGAQGASGISHPGVNAHELRVEGRYVAYASSDVEVAVSAGYGMVRYAVEAFALQDGTTAIAEGAGPSVHLGTEMVYRIGNRLSSSVGIAYTRFDASRSTTRALDFSASEARSFDDGGLIRLQTGLSYRP